jgi:hypothetical protein
MTGKVQKNGGEVTVVVAIYLFGSKEEDEG